MTRPLAVMTGYIGKYPVAGMTLFNLHYMLGLQALGYEVHYVERLEGPDECYDPDTDIFTNDPSYALRYLSGVLRRFNVPCERFSFIDRANNCHGSGWDGLCASLNRADFVLAIGEPIWFDDLERCSRRALVDADPLFTQVSMMDDSAPQGLAHYHVLFTSGIRIGKTDCAIPTAGRRWLPARPPVATDLWDPTPAAGDLPVTALLNWAAWGDVTYDGRVYGHKNREFKRFRMLPRRTSHHFVLAEGGPSPDWPLEEYGWEVVGALEKTRTIEVYKNFIAGSRADFGIAKHAYVASRSGWFSDRSTCFLAAGRPVLHQDTGFGDWLPTGEGVLRFSDVRDVLECLRCLDLDYQRHARAARAIAEEHFEAANVVGQMLDEAGLR